MTASTTIAAGSDGTGMDARPTETEAWQFGAGSMAIGRKVLWTPTGAPTAGAEMDDSDCGPNDRDCTRQMSHVVRYLSAKGRHSGSQRKRRMLMLSPDSN